MLVAVGVSVGRAIAVAVISATTVARMSGVRVGVWVTVGVGVGVGVSVGSGVDVAVGETAMSETSSGSGDGEGVGGSQLRQRASARARATGFHNLVVFTQVLLGAYTIRANIAQPRSSVAHDESEAVSITFTPAPVSGYGAGSLPSRERGRLACWQTWLWTIERLWGWEKVFSKNAPLGPLGPPSKLLRVRSSFELGGAFEKSFLPPLCPLGPRFGCFVD